MATTDWQRRFGEAFEESVAVKRRALEGLLPDLERAARLLADVLGRGGKVLSCGNGGSACDAMHFSSELVNRFERDRAALPAVALVADAPTLTSIANDAQYAEVFARQVGALGRPGDLLLAISTSGRSPNVLRAVETAHENGLSVIALTGRDGGPLAARLRDGDVELRAPSDRTARIQELHLLLIHCLCDAIDHQLFPTGG